MAAKQGPTTAGARPPYADVPAAKGERQDSPPPMPPRTATSTDDPGAVPVAQNPGVALAAPVVPAPPPDAFLTPPLPEQTQLPAAEAGAVAATYRSRASRQKSANRHHRAKPLAKATAAAPEEFEETDEHVRALPETFDSHHPVDADGQPQATQQREVPNRPRAPTVGSRSMPPLWRPQLAVRHQPSLWAPTMRAPLEKPIVLPNSASEVVVNDYIRPPAQQHRAGAVQVEEGGGDLICATCTVVALGFVLVWLYLAISANYRKGRSLVPMEEYSTLEAEERKAEIMPRALEATARTESTAPHLVFNTSEQQGFVILTAAV